MKQTTYMKVRQAYKKLRENNPDVLKFNNYEEMLQEVKDMEAEVAGSPSGWWITRRTNKEPYQPGNLRLVQVVDDSDLDYLIFPSY